MNFYYTYIKYYISSYLKKNLFSKILMRLENVKCRWKKILYSPLFNYIPPSKGSD